MFKVNNTQKGNMNFVIIGAVALLAAGGITYVVMSGDTSPSGDGATAVQTADASPAAGSPDGAPAIDRAATPGEIKAGNPVVAKVGDAEIKRIEVLNFIQNLPPQQRQIPINQLFPMALDQVINAKIVMKKTDNVALDNDPEVKRQLAAAKDQIERSVYLQREVDKKIDDAKLKAAYAEYVTKFPDIQEMKASHILVKEESKAREILKKIQDGGDFATLAKENSIDGTAERGGDLGYFAEREVVPPFAKAAFALKPGEMTKSPVKTDFGFHIIKAEDKRKRPPAAFENVKPMLEAQLRQVELEKIVAEWRNQSQIAKFDINGNAIEPASGETAPAAKPE